MKGRLQGATRDKFSILVNESYSLHIARATLYQAQVCCLNLFCHVLTFNHLQKLATLNYNCENKHSKVRTKIKETSQGKSCLASNFGQIVAFFDSLSVLTSKLALQTVLQNAVGHLLLKEEKNILLHLSSNRGAREQPPK